MSNANIAYLEQDCKGQPQVVSGSGAIASPSVPAFQFSVLECRPSKILVKTAFAEGKDKQYDTTATYLFEYHELETLEEFAGLLRELSSQKRKAIIRGRLKSGFQGWCYKRIHDRHTSDGRTELASVECGPRGWVGFDLDGVPVPEGLGAADKLAEAGYYIRDKMMPVAFHGVRCIAMVTARTGRAGKDCTQDPCVARLRMFFALDRHIENDTIRDWVTQFAKDHPELHVDDSVLVATQFNFTGRPVFDGCSDPVPADCRVVILEGDVEYYTFSYEPTVIPKLSHPQVVIHMGADNKPTLRAWFVIRKMFRKIKEYQTPGGKGRYKALRDVSYCLAHLYADKQLTKEFAYGSYRQAAELIKDDEDEYPVERLDMYWTEALNSVGG